MAEVLVNSQDDVLVNSDGNLLGPNFNFGKGYQGGVNFLSIPSKIGDTISDFSFSWWVKYLNVTLNTYRGWLTITDSTEQNYISIFSHYEANRINIQRMVNGVRSSADVRNLNVSLNSVLNHTITVKNGTAKYYKNGNFVQNIISGLPSFQIALFNLNIGYRVGSETISQSLDRVAKWSFWDREISANEIKSEYNNGLGNELLNRSTLQFELNNRKSEIINIEGLEYAAIRDDNNLNNAVINNLPAGTLQEKVDYANANLFVNFL